MSTERRPRGWPVLGIAVALAVSGCTIPTSEGELEPIAAAVPATTSASAAPTQEPPSADGFAGAFEAFGAGLPGAVGIAVAPVGGGARVATAGEFTSGAAWSTIKVPLAIAALEGPDASAPDAAAAITVSDNAAAEQLWSTLGAPEEAATAVEGVLQRLGDSRTIVPSTSARAEFSIFGQSAWSVADQARFGTALPCAPEAAEVYALMGQVSPDQSWGLGALPGAHFKGGWGPGLTGGYLVRQLGVIDTATGQLAVAIAAETPAGFAEGIALLDQVATWISANPALLPAGGQC